MLRKQLNSLQDNLLKSRKEHRNFEELYQADKADTAVKLSMFESNQHAFVVSGIEKDKRIALLQKQLDDVTRSFTKEIKQRDTETTIALDGFKSKLEACAASNVK